MNRSPEDPNNEPTQRADLGYGNDYGEQGYYSDYREPAGHQPLWSEPSPPTPWYLRPVALIGLGVLTAILISLLVWGMVRLVHKEPATTAPATTSATSTTTPSTTTPAEKSIAPVPVAPSTASGENPPPATETEPPASTTEESTPTTTTGPPTTSSTPETPTTTPSSTATTPSTPAEPSTPTTTRRPPEIVIPLPGL